MKKNNSLTDMMNFTEKFNALSDREKWNIFQKELEENKSLSWYCKHCGIEDDNSPWHASPFSESSVHCGNCEGELTRRTGGGQSDPFNWILK